LGNDLSLYSVVIFIAAIASFPAIYLHVNARAWEAPAIFASLVLALVPGVWYLRVRRRGWLAGILAGLPLAFAGSLALLHGWNLEVAIAVDAVLAALGVILSATLIALLILVVRISRLMASVFREVGKERKNLPPFRDDGERITVFQNRWTWLRACLILAAAFAGVGVTLKFVSMNGYVRIGAFALMGILVLRILTYSKWLLARRATLVVGPDGIADLVTGIGLIDWREILDVATYASSTRPLTLRYLKIVVVDARAVRGRRPYLMRVLKSLILLSSLQSLVPSIMISQELLDQPVDVLSERIRRYARAHAPEGWFGDDDGEEEDSAAEPKP
jgi:hypothetical protein